MFVTGPKMVWSHIKKSEEGEYWKVNSFEEKVGVRGGRGVIVIRRCGPKPTVRVVHRSFGLTRIYGGGVLVAGCLSL